MLTQRIEPGHDLREFSAERDQQLRQRIFAVLRDSGYWALSQLKCDVTNGNVVLSGTVSSYFLKQVAQTLALRIETVKVLENRIDVYHG